jgi:hypothetical protein
MTRESELTMKIGHWAVIAPLVLFIDFDMACAAASATSVRFVCDSPVTGGVPNKFEIDFSHKTILEFEGSGTADDPIALTTRARMPSSARNGYGGLTPPTVRNTRSILRPAS